MKCRHCGVDLEYYKKHFPQRKEVIKLGYCMNTCALLEYKNLSKFLKKRNLEDKDAFKPNSKRKGDAE